MASEKQEQANFRNAQLSTGPVSSEGKAIVARNAVKHGIFAKDLVISAGDGREDELEYFELLAEMKRDLAPVGRMEMILVEKIAVNYWRLRRLVRFETGEIRERLDDFRENALSSHYSSSYNAWQRPNLEYYDFKDEISDAEYRKQCYKVAAMNCSGFDIEKDKEALEYILVYKMDRPESEFEEEDYDEARKYAISLSRQMKGKLRKEMLEEARDVMFEMEEVRNWQVRFDRIHKTKSLPATHVLDKIIKYENSLERSIFRNLAALKTLQETRTKVGSSRDQYLQLPVSND